MQTRKNAKKFFPTVQFSVERARRDQDGNRRDRTRERKSFEQDCGHMIEHCSKCQKIKEYCDCEKNRKTVIMLCVCFLFMILTYVFAMWAFKVMEF